MVSPYLRTMKPIPPPVVSPPNPTLDVSPVEIASPWTLAAAANSPELTPVCTRAVRVAGSISIPFMADRSTTTAPSGKLWPARLCPPLRTASG